MNNESVSDERKSDLIRRAYIDGEVCFEDAESLLGEAGQTDFCYLQNRSKNEYLNNTYDTLMRVQDQRNLYQMALEFIEEGEMDQANACLDQLSRIGDPEEDPQKL